MKTLAYNLYNFVLVRIAYLTLQIVRPFSRGKLREMINDKNSRHEVINSQDSKSLSAKKPFWIHAASGEIEYARPVMRELKKQHPEIPILVTYSSPSAKKILAAIPEIDAWCALPWDLKSELKIFLKKWQPRMLLVARTDVWPNMIEVCVEDKVPSLLFSATFANNSSRLRGFTKFLTSYSLNKMNGIHCVTEEDISNLHQLQLVTPLFVSGDTRFDQVFHRLENPKPLKNELIPSPEEMIFIAGSSWPEDDKVLLPAIKKMQHSAFKSILAPHEVHEDHLKYLEEQIIALGLKSQRYTQATSWKKNHILIVDTVGILAELYTWADLAFIGGSFKKQVHSVMEALAAGVPVMVGPHHLNNREALHYQKKSYSSGMIVQVVQNSADISLLMQRFKKQHHNMANIKQEIRLEISRNKNSTLRIVQSVESMLNF